MKYHEARLLFCVGLGIAACKDSSDDSAKSELTSPIDDSGIPKDGPDRLAADASRVEETDTGATSPLVLDARTVAFGSFVALAVHGNTLYASLVVGTARAGEGTRSFLRIPTGGGTVSQFQQVQDSSRLLGLSFDSRAGFYFAKTSRGVAWIDAQRVYSIDDGAAAPMALVNTTDPSELVDIRGNGTRLFVYGTFDSSRDCKSAQLREVAAPTLAPPAVSGSCTPSFEVSSQALWRVDGNVVNRSSFVDGSVDVRYVAPRGDEIVSLATVGDDLLAVVRAHESRRDVILRISKTGEPFVVASALFLATSRIIGVDATFVYTRVGDLGFNKYRLDGIGGSTKIRNVNGTITAATTDEGFIYYATRSDTVSDNVPNVVLSRIAK